MLHPPGILIVEDDSATAAALASQLAALGYGLAGVAVPSGEQAILPGRPRAQPAARARRPRPRGQPGRHRHRRQAARERRRAGGLPLERRRCPGAVAPARRGRCRLPEHAAPPRGARGGDRGRRARRRAWRAHAHQRGAAERHPRRHRRCGGGDRCRRAGGVPQRQRRAPRGARRCGGGGCAHLRAVHRDRCPRRDRAHPGLRLALRLRAAGPRGLHLPHPAPLRRRRAPCARGGIRARPRRCGDHAP